MKSNARRGAQPGNRNALKHGFYSSAFKQQEKAALARTGNADLSGEIDLIRVASLRFLEALQQAPGPIDVQTHLAALRAVNLSAQSIAGLIRVQAFAGHGRDLQSLQNQILMLEMLRNINEEDALLSPEEVERRREQYRRELEEKIHGLPHADESS